MDLDDSGPKSRTRADLEAELRALEEKRDLLEAHIAAARTGRAEPGAPQTKADPAAMLQALEGILKAVQPVLANMTTAREMLITDRAEALNRNDPASANEATRMIDGVSGVVEELSGSIAQLQAVADKVRASIESSNRDEEGG